MKQLRQIVILSVAVTLFVPAVRLLAQHEQHHSQAPAKEPQKPEAMKMCPMAAMMAERQKMEKLVGELVESFDRVRTLEDASQRQVAMEEHARLLLQLRDALRLHPSTMADMMKMCPMMQKSAMGQEQPQPKE